MAIRAHRNFWLTADIDGRSTPLAGGPRSKTGEMDVTIYARDHGESRPAVRILCRVLPSGALRVMAQPAEGDGPGIDITTER